jgi:hypothetical protein
MKRPVKEYLLGIRDILRTRESAQKELQRTTLCSN